MSYKEIVVIATPIQPNFNNKKRIRLKSGASPPLMIWVVVVLPAENFFVNVRIGKHCPNRLAKIIRCRQRQFALCNRIAKHGFCCSGPLNLGTGGDTPSDTATRTGQSRSLRSMAVALCVSFDIVFHAELNAKMQEIYFILG